LLEASGLSAKLPSTGLPLGILDSTTIPTGRSVVLRPGQCVILVTDGFVESQDRERCCFGIDRVLQVAQAHLHQSARQIIEAVFREVERFNGGAPPNDDRTAVVIKAEGGGPAPPCPAPEAV
jgi:serine phosphatase RsbU (regulator of sigma subunit)